MTAAQKDKKENIVKGMKKSKSFGKSKDEKDKMYAAATKLAKKDKSLKEQVQALFEDDMVNENIANIAKNFIKSNHNPGEEEDHVTYEYSLKEIDPEIVNYLKSKGRLNVTVKGPTSSYDYEEQ